MGLKAPARTPEKPKKIRQGDEYYVNAGSEVMKGLQIGDTLRVRAMINRYTITVDVIHAGEETVSNTITISPTFLKSLPEERRISDNTRPISPERTEELANPTDLESFPLRASDEPQQVRKLTLEAIRDKLATAGLEFFEK